MNKETSEIVPGAPHPRGGAVAIAQPGAARVFGAAEAAQDDGGAFSPRELLRVIGKWRWLIAGATVAMLVFAAVSTMLTPKMYRAMSQVELSLQTVSVSTDKGGDSDAMTMRDPQFIGTQLGLLRSRDLAERVARSLSGDARAKLAPGVTDPTAQIKAATGAVAGGLRIDPVTGSRLINITYQSRDPNLAAIVANSVADNYIESNLERKYDASAFARKFLQQRLTTTKAALEKSERELVEYATREKIVMVGGGEEGGTNGTSGSQSLDSSTLTSLNQALATAQSERIAAQQKFQQEGSAASQSQVINSGAVGALKSERAKLQVDYQEKLGTFKADYPEMVALRTRIRELDGQIARASSEIAGSVTTSYAGEYRAALGRENALKARVAQLTSGVLNLRNRQIQYNILQREVETNRTLYDGLLQRFKQVSVEGGVGASQVSIVDRALVPGGPYSPNLINNLLVALILGLLIGAGAAFGIEYIDDTIKNPDDVRNRLHLTLLGVVPSVGKGMTMLEALEDPSSAQSEAYLSTRTAIKFTSAGGTPKSLLITSSQAAEGKSSSCFAIARGFARLGQTVLLIDADMRKPSFSTSDSATDAGLSALLASRDELRNHIKQTAVPNLFLLPSGPIPPNPVELLGGQRLRDVLAEAEGMFDIVIFDSPPVMGLADAPLLASVVDAAIFVIQAGRIRRPAALRALARLEQSGARIVGGVITKFDLKGASYGYGYGYGYGYSYGQKQMKSDVATARQIALEPK